MLRLSLFLISLFSICMAAPLQAQRHIRNIYFEKLDVFDSTQKDWFFAAKTVNSLHTQTRDYVIEDELLFHEGDTLNEDALDETERNLRRTLLFTRVSIRTEDVGDDMVDVVVVTQDKWSTMGEFLFGTGGGATTYGASVREENLAGSGILLGGSALHRTENNIGWQGYLNVNARRALRSSINLNMQVLSNRLRTVQQFSLEKPFLTLNSRQAYSLVLQNSYGDDFYYNDGLQAVLLPYHTRRVGALLAGSSGGRDRYFWSFYASVEDVQRLKPEFRQAFDNSGRLLFSLGSLKQDFIQPVNVDGYETKDIAVGAWGQAVFGYIFPMKGGERLTYVGARAEQSGRFAEERLYLYGSVEASSAFGSSQGRYTYVESNGLAHYRLSSELVFATRFRQQTAWNWSAFRQLILDNDGGLRGYPLNELSGDNRILTNTEIRFFPKWDFWIFRLGAAAFYDGGMVWNQSQNLGQTRMHHAVGFGLRIFNLKTSGSAAIFRIDFAYNVDQGRFAGIIFTSDQLFSAFGSHTYKAPYLGGVGIDVE